MPDWRSLALDVLRGGVEGATTGVLGGPVDLAAMVLRPLGYDVEKPVGGGEWWRDQFESLGMYRPRTGTPAETVGEVVGSFAAPGPDPLQYASLGMLGMGAIRAYHGSPHTFDRFDMSKIGAGEGAQAYGHGLYFTETPEIAKGYRERLSGYDPRFDDKPVVIRETGEPATAASVAQQFGVQPDALNMPDSYERYFEAITAHKGDADAAMRALEDRLAPMRGRPMFDKRMSDYRSLHEKIGGGVGAQEPGAFYTVDLDVEPEDLLDWDAPLSQQSEKVRQALGAAGIGGRQVQFNKPGEDLWYGRDAVTGDLVGKIQQHRRGFTVEAFGNDKGGEFPTLEAAQAALSGNSSGVGVYNALAQRAGGDAKASEFLRNAGIPGIRYLDGVSRASGEGTRNFVLFDDALVALKDRNGQPVKP